MNNRTYARVFWKPEHEEARKIRIIEIEKNGLTYGLSTVFLSTRTVTRILFCLEAWRRKALTHPTINSAWSSSSSFHFLLLDGCRVLLFEALDSNGMSGIHKFISPRTNLDFMWIAEKKLTDDRAELRREKVFYAFWNYFYLSFLRFKVLVHL